jgi:hypothetical protein
VTLYDRFYRYWHGLNDPAATVDPILRIETRRSHSSIQLADKTMVCAGDLICVIHLNNDRIGALHSECPSPTKVALEFRRQVLASLRELGRMTEPGGRLAGVRAFSATTIFHDALKRLGFAASGPLVCPGLVAIYQRALLASLHPAGRSRLRRATYRRAERLWISRDKLLQL